MVNIQRKLGKRKKALCVKRVKNKFDPAVRNCMKDIT